MIRYTFVTIRDDPLTQVGSPDIIRERIGGGP